MNSDGVFASCQLLLPDDESAGRRQADDVDPWQVFLEALYQRSSTAQVLDRLDGRRVVPASPSVHSLIADSVGDAVVVEPGNEGTGVTRIDREFIVMTNFANSAFREKDYAQVTGSGAKRYIRAWERIRGARRSMESLRLSRPCALRRRKAATSPSAPWYWIRSRRRCISCSTVNSSAFGLFR